MNQAVAQISEQAGLSHWMSRVLAKHAALREGLSAEPVHDLRVSLRRCILIADVMRGLDPIGEWKPMRKSAKRLFRRLGALRDAQVLSERVKRLAPPDDALAAALLESLRTAEEQARAAATEAVREFDRKRWRAWSQALTKRYLQVAREKPACESLALDAWAQLREQQRRARKSRSAIAFHRVRIALKRFRYLTENFLHSRHQAWSVEIKQFQDILGEIHDLDVLRQTILRIKVGATALTRAAWLARLKEERDARLLQYLERTRGKNSPFRAWRDVLPQDKEAKFLGLARLELFARFVTPDFPHAQRVARLSLQLYDGLAGCHLNGNRLDGEKRLILRAAALLHDVGLARTNKAHHKASYRMIRGLVPPGGWSRHDLELAALIARFHRRALPRPEHKSLRTLPQQEREWLVLLAAALRLANAFDARHDGGIRRIEVEDHSGVLAVRADGFHTDGPLASKMSGAKHLLEFACHRPVLILPGGGHVLAPRAVPQPAASDAA